MLNKNDTTKVNKLMHNFGEALRKKPKLNTLI